MKTRYLVVALSIIVSIFLTRGFYVAHDVRVATVNSYAELELLSNTINPLMLDYEEGVVDNIIKYTHTQISSDVLSTALKDAENSQDKLLVDYVASTHGKDNADDKELYVRAIAVDIYIDKMRLLCLADNTGEISNTLYNGELYKIIDPTLNCLHRIVGNKLKMANTYKAQIYDALDSFNVLIMYASSLAAILIILSLRIKEKPVIRRKKAKKKNLKTRTAIKKN